MNKDSSGEFEKYNFSFFFDESIVPQGVIGAVILPDKSIGFNLIQSNKAFKSVSQLTDDPRDLSAREAFEFLEGFSCQPLLQYYKSENSHEVQFIYSAGEIVYKLSFKKAGDKIILFVLQNITDLQEARSELNEKKRQLKESQEIAHLGYWIENHASHKHFWSDQIYKILNELPENIKPSFSNYLNFVYDDDQKRVKEAFNAAINNKTGYDITHRLRLKNGTIKYISQRCYTNYDFNDNPVQSVGIIQDITSSEILKEELKKNEAIFRSVFEFAPIAIILVSREFKPVFCNSQFCELVGYSMVDIFNQDLKSVTYPDDYENNRHQYNRLFKGEIKSFSISKRYQHKDGTLLWAKVIVSALKNDAGIPEMAIAMAQDITAEKKATEALIKSEYRYRTLIDNANDGIGLFDYNFDPIIYNSALHEMLGYTREEYLKLDHNNLELFHPDDIPNVQIAIAKLRNNERARIDNRLRNKDGSFSYFSISYIPVTHEEKPAILIFRRDITQQKKAELQNEEYRLFLETIMDNLPVSLFAKTTPDFRYLYWNNTMERTTGISADIAIGKTDFELYPLKQLAQQYFDEDEKLLKFRNKLESEYEFINSLGEPKQFRTIKTLHLSDIGNPIILGISMDITKLKEAEKQVQQSTQMLKEAQKIASLGYWEYDVKKDLFFDNLENRQILGIEKLPYFINRQQFLELLHDTDQELLQQAFDKCIADKTPGEEIIRLHALKESKYVSIKYRAVEDHQGNVEKLRGTCLDISKIRKSELALRESEKRLKTAEHIAKVGYYDYDYSTGETNFSDEIWKVLELTPHSIKIGFSELVNRVFEEDKLKVLSQFDEAKNRAQAFEIEFRIVTHLNSTKYIRVIGTFVNNIDGNLTRSIGTFQDVTDFIQNETILKKVADQLSEIQNIAKIGFIEYQRNEKTIKISDTLYDILELNKESKLLFLEDYDKLIHPDDRETIIKTIKKAINQNYPYNIRYRLKLTSGKVRFVNEIYSVKTNKPEHITRIIQDITSHKEQEFTLNKISEVQKSTLVGTYEYNIDSRTYYFDKMLLNLLNLPESSAVLTADDFYSLIHIDDRYSVSKLVDESVKVRENFTLTYRLATTTGKVVFIQNFSNFFTNVKGENIMYGMIRDITDYRIMFIELEERKLLFENIAENSLIGIVIYDTTKRIYANKKWAELIGVNAENLNKELRIRQIYYPETIKLIFSLFRNWKNFGLKEYSNKLTFKPLNAPEFTAEINIKEIMIQGNAVFLIVALPCN